MNLFYVGPAFLDRVTFDVGVLVVLAFDQADGDGVATKDQWDTCDNAKTPRFLAWSLLGWGLCALLFTCHRLIGKGSYS